MKAFYLGLTLLLLAGCTPFSPLDQAPAATLPAEAGAEPQPAGATTDPAVAATPTFAVRVEEFEPAERVPASTAVPVMGEVPEEILTAILADLSATSAIARASMTVLQAETLVWPDGALGCPQPGVEYTQEPVPGYHVVIAAADQTYDYRVNDRGFFSLCAQPAPPPAPGTPTS